MIRTANVAELKNRLSAYLQLVRAGDEVLVRDRLVPIARIVPLSEEGIDAEEASLVASGQMSLPKRKFDEKHFWSIGARVRKSGDLTNEIRRAMDAERKDTDAGILGHKRSRSSVHPRPSK
jgi:antitoxin (DNA-binding transcriptional repressor) of toxin-antitoxin stability system